MIETSAPFAFDASERRYAHWAVKKPRRGFDVAALFAAAIMRVRPLVLVNVALLVCAASGAGMFLVVAHALGAAA